MKNSIFRLLVCLVLVCVILVNCSPIRARAVEPVTMMIGAGIVIAAAIIGLGVMMGTDPIVFDELVQKVAAHEKMADIISVDFKLPVIKYNAITGGIDPQGMSWALSVLVLETIREILYDDDVIVENSPVTDDLVFGDIALPYASVWDSSKFPYANLIGFFNSSGVAVEYRLNWAASEFRWSINSDTLRWYDCYYSTYSVSSSSWSTVFKASSSGMSTTLNSGFSMRLLAESAAFGGADPAPISSIGVSDGLTAGKIAPQAQTILDGYPSWSSGSLIDENQNYWYPIGIGQTYDETKTYTQEQVQSGESTYQEEDTGSDEESDAVTATGLKKWISDFKSSVDMWFARVSLNVSNTYDAVTEGLSGLGQGIANLPSAILSGIYDFFVPSAEAMAAQQDKWTMLLSDRFGAVYDSVALIDNIAGAFTLGATQTQIRFPLITIPFADVNWEFGGWMVDVVPDGFQVLVDALKVGIDILCTLAFVNAMKHRMERVLEGRG